MNTFHLEIVVPDKAFYSEEVQELIIKTPDGEIGILQGHIPMVVAVSIGFIKIKKDDKWLNAFVSEGFMEVTGDKTVVLTDSAEWPDEIDVERAKAAEERARKRLSTRLDYKEHISSEAALQRAISRQKVAEKGNEEK
jgi:F-type H+-transporting ATPase subunit epsilon